MIARSFHGLDTVRIDGKGRVAIPAKYRRVLVENDPDHVEGGPCTMMLNYGDNLVNHLEVRTVAAFEAIAREFAEWRPETEEEAQEKDDASYYLLTQSEPIEIAPDGRCVIPARIREHLGIGEGMVTVAGKGDLFELWSAETFEAEVSRPKKERSAARPLGWNPLTALARGRKG